MALMPHNHYRAAEGLLEKVRTHEHNSYCELDGHYSDDVHYVCTRNMLLAAQVHATLATVDPMTASRAESADAKKQERA